MGKMTARAFGIGLIVLGSSLVSHAARADATASAVEARAHFDRGVALYQDGILAGALAEFRRADALAPAYRLKFNIAQVCLEQHDYACALGALRGYLAGGGTEIPKRKRATVEQELKTLGTFVAELSLSADTPGAEVSLDDAPLGTVPLSEPVLVNAGRHRVSARHGALFATRTVEVTGGERVAFVLLLAPPSARPAAGPSREPARVNSATPPPDRTLAWATGIGAGVFLAGAAVTGLLALHESSDLSTARTTYPADESDLRARRDKISALALAADVLGVLGLASGAGAVYFALRPAGTPAQPAAALGVSGSF